ncbi:MAG: hypothetical protein ACRDZU_02915 [Acidimicrobiales bacterium]
MALVVYLVRSNLRWRAVTDGLGAPNLPQVAWLATLLGADRHRGRARHRRRPERRAAQMRPSATLRAE